MGMTSQTARDEWVGKVIRFNQDGRVLKGVVRDASVEHYEGHGEIVELLVLTYAGWSKKGRFHEHHEVCWAGDVIEVLGDIRDGGA